MQQTKLNYDQHQFFSYFGKRHSYAASAAHVHQTEGEHFAFSDYERMQTQIRGQRTPEWTPPFAANEHELSLAIAQRVWMFCNLKGRVPDYIAGNLQLLKMLAEFRFQKQLRHPLPKQKAQAFIIASQLHTIARAGGYLNLQLAVAYRSWRLGQDSVTVAQSLGISPCKVRVILTRIRYAARKIGLKDFEQPHHSRGRNVQKHVDILWKLVRANRGKLPAASWLSTNGYWRSYDVVSRAKVLGQFPRAWRNKGPRR